MEGVLMVCPNCSELVLNSKGILKSASNTCPSLSCSLYMLSHGLKSDQFVSH